MGVNGATARTRDQVPGAGPRFDPGHVHRAPVRFFTPRCPACGEHGFVGLSRAEWDRLVAHPARGIDELLPDRDALTREQVKTGRHPACTINLGGEP